MSKEIKTIGVLTSGGDAPGMNAAIRAVVRTAVFNGVKALGVRQGYNGLINGDIIELDARSVGDTMQRGGTILQTARCKEFRELSGVQKGIDTARKFGMDALVVIGGDGSFRGAKDLCALGFPTVALPGTIDNDISCTEYTIGYDTCLATVVDAVDKLRDTSSSHSRCSVVEVMGRNAGHIAVNAGIACGAEVVLIPERKWDFENDVVVPILSGKGRGKTHFIVIVAEGVGKSFKLAERIEERTGIESRATVLGHVQRGGKPSVRDRVVASQMGNYAVEIILAGKSNRLICERDNKIVDIDIEEGLAMKKDISEDLVKLTKVLSV